GTPRTKAETITALKTKFLTAQTPGSGSKIKQMHTESGVKDTYQNFFIERLLNSYKRRRGVSANSAHEAIADLYPDTMSPVWRI
ncbi:hypothetical protein BDP27DRAFT_1236033, partial [Rhodocollybia butyracea]